MAGSKVYMQEKKIRWTGFPGIGRGAPGHDTAARDICNFRPEAGGVLRKRAGFRRALVLPDPVRALFCGRPGEFEHVFAVAGGAIYELDLDAGSYVRLNELLSQSGPASFVYFDGELCLLDGREVRRYRADGGFLPEEGYIPLYGKDWLNTSPGEHYRPFSMLTPRVMITYRISENNRRDFLWDFRAEAVDRFVVDGEVIPPEEIIFHSSKKGLTYNRDTISIKEAMVVLRVTPPDNAALLSCTQAVAYGPYEDSRLYCYGGVDGSMMYPSRYVSDEDLALCRSYLPDTGRLYFVAGDEVRIGDGRYALMGACRNHDKLMLFSEAETWTLDYASVTNREFPARYIHSGVGASSFEGVVLCDDTPVSVSRDGVFRWETTGLERDECAAVCLSREIAEAVPKGFFDGATLYRFGAGRELWVSNPAVDGETVWLLSEAEGMWVRYRGLCAEHFFARGEAMGFSHGGAVFLFDESLTADEEGDEVREIEAAYDSPYYDFLTPERVKRGGVMTLCGHTGGGRLTLTLSGDGGESVTHTVTGEMCEGPEYFDVRIAVPRYRALCFSVRGVGRARQALFGAVMVPASSERKE